MQWTEKDFNKMDTAIKKGYEYQSDTPEKALNYWWQVWNKINNFSKKNKSRSFYDALDTWSGWDTAPAGWMTDFEDALINYGRLDQKIEYCEIMLKDYDDISSVSLRMLSNALAKAYIEKGDIKKSDAFYKTLLNSTESDLTVWVDYANTFTNGSRVEVDYEKALKTLEEGERRLNKRQISRIGSNDLFQTMAELYDKLEMPDKAQAARANIQRESDKKESFFSRLFKKK